MKKVLPTSLGMSFYGDAPFLTGTGRYRLSQWRCKYVSISLNLHLNLQFSFIYYSLEEFEMYYLGKELFVGNIALSIYVETLSPAIEQEGPLLRDSDAEYISSHLFNLSQAESIVDILNDYLDNPVTAVSLLKFLNDEADCFESIKLEAKEKKQRYVIIIVNALASTLWAHKEMQERFLN